MSIIHFLVTVGLFVLLTPGILLRLPSNGSKWTVAAVHGIVFALVLYFLHYYILPYFNMFEGFAQSKSSSKNMRSFQWSKSKLPYFFDNKINKI